MPEDIIIRAMEEADIPAALELWKAVFTPKSSAANERREVIARYLARNPGLSTAAVDAQGALIGTVLCGHDGRRGSLFHAAVIPAFRRHGIARRMQERCVEALRREGVGSAFLLVTPINPGSQEFWISVGWEVFPEVRYVFKTL